MECRNFTHDVMLDHSERLLDPRSRQEADEHLSRCRSCRERYEEVRRIAGAVRKTLQAPAHNALVQQLEAGVMAQFAKFQAGKHRVTSRRRVYWAVAIAAAAAVLVAVIVGVTWRDAGTPPPNGIVRNPEPTPQPVPEPPRPEPKVEPQPTPEPAPTPEVKPPIPQPPPPEPEPRRVKPVPPPEEAKLPKIQPPNPEIEPLRKPAFVKGDFNRSGSLDLRDADFLDREILAGRTYDPASADLNGDGRVDCGDVLAIIQQARKHP